MNDEAALSKIQITTFWQLNKFGTLTEVPKLSES
jgi:hypothetical protein